MKNYGKKQNAAVKGSGKRTGITSAGYGNPRKAHGLTSSGYSKMRKPHGLTSAR